MREISLAFFIIFIIVYVCFCLKESSASKTNTACRIILFVDYYTE